MQDLLEDVFSGTSGIPNPPVESSVADLSQFAVESTEGSTTEESTTIVAPTIKRRRGRPKGSKNRPKVPPVQDLIGQTSSIIDEEVASMTSQYQELMDGLNNADLSSKSDIIAALSKLFAQEAFWKRVLSVKYWNVLHGEAHDFSPEHREAFLRAKMAEYHEKVQRISRWIDICNQMLFND